MTARPALPRHLVIRLRAARDASAAELGRPPAAEELARRAGLGRSVCRQFLREATASR